MELKEMAGNAVIALGSFTGAKSVILSVASAPTAAYHLELTAPYLLVGFNVPNWLSILFFIISLIFGTAASINQPTPVDIQFKHPFLQPFYSLSFGVLMSLFIVPIFYPEITLWSLIVPAGFFAAVGSVVIFYIIAFFKSEKLWAIVTLEAHKSAPEIISMLFNWGKGILKALVGRADK